jgi:hypothetical protein
MKDGTVTFYQKVEQYTEQAQGENVSQVIQLSNVNRAGQILDASVSQSSASLTKLTPRADLKDARKIEGNSFVRVTIESVSDEEVEEALKTAQPAAIDAQAASQTAMPNQFAQQTARVTELQPTAVQAQTSETSQQ